MPSLMELVEKVNKGEMVDPQQLEVYQDSSNSAEKFLAHHAQAMLDLRRAQQHMMQSLEAIDYGDQKVLSQFMSVSSFLGLTDLRAGPVVKFGASAIARRDFALGLEAIQNGITFDIQHGGTWSSDRENCQFVASQYDRAAQWIGWRSEQPATWTNRQTRIGIIVSSIADEEAAGRFIRGFAKCHDSKRFKLFVYSTEAGLRREKQQFTQATYTQASSKRGTQTLEELTRQKIIAWTAPSDGDVVTAAKSLAAQLINDKIDVALLDATQADPIASLIARWDTAAVKVNLVRTTPLYAGSVSTVAYLDAARFEADQHYWQKYCIDSRFVLEGIDADATHGAMPQRSVYGIPEQSIVLATAGNDLDRTLSHEFVETVIGILRSNPQTIYLLVGDGELAWQKRRFDSAGVAKRIGYAGKRKDLPGFLRIADVYLAEFPSACANGVLQAMSVERAIVAMKSNADEMTTTASTSSIVGSEAIVPANDATAYAERVTKVIRDGSFRKKLGQSMRTRLEQHFSFAQTAAQIEQLCEQLLRRRSEAAPEGSADDFRTVMAAAANFTDASGERAA